MTPQTPEESTTIRDRILESAEERFRQYGYRKTSMAEIAGDLHMSAANLYRYFQNKEDIAAGCAVRCFSRRDELLREVLHRPGISAVERLREFVLTILRYTYDETHNNPNINELVNVVVGRRQDVVHQKIGATQSMLAEILAEGNRSGEFRVADIVRTAETLYAALVLFSTPLFMQFYPLEELERMARQVVDLLISGLAVH
jgi:AcrR family transcriptional regulator